jgi:hypothetical protein
VVAVTTASVVVISSVAVGVGDMVMVVSVLAIGRIGSSVNQGAALAETTLKDEVIDIVLDVCERCDNAMSV